MEKNINWNEKKDGDQYYIEGVDSNNEYVKVATDSLNICLSIRLKKGKKFLVRERVKHLISEVIGFA
ncbi:MAG: hypothetical protein M1308_09510 [Actinobacteria bacterium]|jgi:hypothetical protein|nr:hypothetical protein [Actinomycetota bacterium]